MFLKSTLSSLLPFTFLIAPSFAQDGTDLNAVFRFKKIYLEKAQDNVDGVFKAPIESSLKDFFAANPRFEKTEEKAASDGALLVKVEKKAEILEVSAMLSLSSSGEVFSQEKLSIPSDIDGVILKERITAAVKATVNRIPFFGTVTGREGTQVTLDVGDYHGVKEGDLVQISRIDAVRRHPLLKQVIDISMISVGVVRITHAEEGLSFGTIESEVIGESIKRLHKIAGVEAAPIAKTKKQSERPNTNSYDFSSEELKWENLPHYGFIDLGLGVSGFSHSANLNNSNLKEGGAFAYGLKLGTEIWFTSNFFADLKFIGSMMNYSGDTGSLDVTNGFSSTTRTIAFHLGYRFLFDQLIYGPQISLKLGYLNYRWQTPTFSADLITSRVYSGFDLGVAGMMPFNKKRYGAFLDVSILLFPGYQESTEVISKSNGSSTAVFFQLGPYYYVSTEICVKAALDFQTYSTDVSDLGKSGYSNQKSIGFMPSIQYLF